MRAKLSQSRRVLLRSRLALLERLKVFLRGDGARGGDCRLHQVPAVVPVRGFARLSPRARGGEKVHRSIVIAQMSRRDASGGEGIAQGDGLAQFLRDGAALVRRRAQSSRERERLLPRCAGAIFVQRAREIARGESRHGGVLRAHALG